MKSKATSFCIDLILELEIAMIGSVSLVVVLEPFL